MHKPIISLFTLLLFITPLAQAEISARQIMDAVDDRDDGDNAISDMQMVLIDKKGHQRIREIRSFGKDKGEDRQRIMFFIKPADVEDTGFLTYDYDDSSRDDDQWLYLPALRKTKRIASSDKSGSFMGSDFNYSDMTRRNLDAYDFKILKEDEVRSHKVWLIEALPKTKEEAKETGYKKSVVFVRQDNFVVVRAIHWVEGSSRRKYQDVKRLEQIDGIWTILEMDMTTKKGKAIEHKTILKFNNMRYNQDLDQGTFSIRRLEQGL